MELQLHNITYHFSTEKQLFTGLSLALENKQIYALMGSNGAGKTTLFNLINGFIKPQAGEIVFQKKNLTAQEPYKINRLGIGRTFQDVRLITKLTVKENILLSMNRNPTENWVKSLTPEIFHRKSNKELNEKKDAIVEQFFLRNVENSRVAEISYGQQKLLSLACCVANGASLLLLDEAVAGVQPEYCNKIITLIKQLKEQGKTILLIEHNTDFIGGVADKIFFLHEGIISTFENVEQLRNDNLVKEAYI